jgi:single-strand DNA-binding protein
MSRGINKVILLGNLGLQPELKRFKNGDCMSNASLATSSSWKDKNSGDKKEITEWHKLVFSGKSAEILVQYCRKGSKLFIEGRLQTRKWQNPSGVEQYTTEIRVLDFQMLDSKQSVSQSANTQGKPIQPFVKPTYTQNPSIPDPVQNQYNKDEIDWDDGIPF